MSDGRVDPDPEGARDRAGVDERWCREIAGRERRRDHAQVRADLLDSGRILAIAAQGDASAIRPRLERMGRRVLVDAHSCRAARLHRGEARVWRRRGGRLLCRVLGVRRRLVLVRVGGVGGVA